MISNALSPSISNTIAASGGPPQDELEENGWNSSIKTGSHLSNVVFGLETRYRGIPEVNKMASGLAGAIPPESH
jgi:hypothetical protein